MTGKKFATMLLSFVTIAATAQNPIVQTWYTTDPAPMVYGDKMYVYTGHDEDKADFFWMNEWRVYSSSDMVNWTDHGEILRASQVPWGKPLLGFTMHST